MKTSGLNRRRRQISRKLQEINLENANYVESLEEISSQIIPTVHANQEELEQDYLSSSILSKLIFKLQNYFYISHVPKKIFNFKLYLISFCCKKQMTDIEDGFRR